MCCSSTRRTSFELAGDVNFVVLDVLPRLQEGVIVHFHDIFLPWEYPRSWLTEMGYYWTEQYLLQAFLAYNREFEVLVPAQAAGSRVSRAAAGCHTIVHRRGQPRIDVATASVFPSR